MSTDVSLTKVVVHSAGAHDKLVLETGPALHAAAGEVVVDVRAIGINYADVIVRMGLYASAKELVGWPITPGFEVSGVVAEVGAGVTDLEVGNRVCAVTLFDGYATQVKVPRRQVFAIADDLPFEQAAALPAVFLTAWYALKELANPRPGLTILVHSAAGGVGSSLVQLGKALDLTVVGVVGGSHKVQTARDMGCDHVIDKSTEDLWARAEAFCPDGYDVILDANGVATLSDSYGHLRRTGRLVVYGFSTMFTKGAAKPSYLKLAMGWLRTPRFNPLDMVNASKSVLAFNLSYLFDREDILSVGMGDVMDLLRAGKLKPPPVSTYPLADVARAHADIESGNSVGKLVLIP
ncbi:MAG: NADPH:quinone reductase-like Zn-dependent oxidoreductase [Myxococcota bacterium]|jgi:NADPH:quinone reductase-like Zn-dependent oxidoreductase